MQDLDTQYNVRAHFADMESARRGIAAVERAGVPASDIRLEGRSAVEASRQSDTSGSDEIFIREAEKAVFGGAAIGAGAGALLGLFAGLVFLDPTWPAAAVAAAGGAAGGGGLGFVANAIARLQQTDAVELTYHDVDNSDVYVAVHTDDRDDVEKAAHRLRRAGSAVVEATDGRGNPLPSTTGQAAEAVR